MARLSILLSILVMCMVKSQIIPLNAPPFTLADVAGNGTKWVQIGNENGEYQFNGYCRIWSDLCGKRSRMENSFTAMFKNSSSLGDAKNGVPPGWTMIVEDFTGHGHLGTCDDPRGHWMKDTSVTQPIEKNELWLPMRAGTKHVFTDLEDRPVFEGDRPASFVIHHQDTGAMFACCEYTYTDIKKCSAPQNAVRSNVLMVAASAIVIMFSLLR